MCTADHPLHTDFIVNLVIYYVNFFYLFIILFLFLIAILLYRVGFSTIGIVGKYCGVKPQL